MEYGEGKRLKTKMFLVFRLKCNYHLKIFSTYLPFGKQEKWGRGGKWKK